MEKFDYSIGYGYDVHKLVKGRKLILGGVEIPHSKGLEGHSDADVLLHSICDALLGAAGLNDIGHQFPNTEEKYKNISSLILLEETYRIISREKWKIVNIDATIVLEEPKIFNFTPLMKENISKILKIKTISIKATTAEGLGFVGKKQGCEAKAVALLQKKYA